MGGLRIPLFRNMRIRNGGPQLAFERYCGQASPLGHTHIWGYIIHRSVIALLSERLKGTPFLDSGYS